jgi:hypothetical protein
MRHYRPPRAATIAAMLDASRAMDFVRSQGLVLASAKGPAPRLIEAILGEAISGNWWSHPQANAIFRVLSAVADDEQVLVCRLLAGRLTLVHRRLWPALVRLADRFPAERIARVEEQHTPSGKHVHRDTPFPDWVTEEVKVEAAALSPAQARALLAAHVPVP